MAGRKLMPNRLRCTEKHVRQVVDGKAAFTEDMALWLMCVFGDTAGF